MQDGRAGPGGRGGAPTCRRCEESYSYFLYHGSPNVGFRAGTKADVRAPMVQKVRVGFFASSTGWRPAAAAGTRTSILHLHSPLPPHSHSETPHAFSSRSRRYADLRRHAL